MTARLLAVVLRLPLGIATMADPTQVESTRADMEQVPTRNRRHLPPPLQWRIQ